MKRIAFTLLALIPLLLSAQSYILRGGPKVYRYEKAQKRWSTNPLPLGTQLNNSDFITSETNFTLEVLPVTVIDKIKAQVNPFHTNSCITYIAYPRTKYPQGVRLSSNLTKFNRTAKYIRGGYVPQGVNDKVFLSHLSWAYHECIKEPKSCIEDSTSSVDVILTSSSLCLDSISVSDSLKITLINKNDYNIFVYVLWKDKKWILWDWDEKEVVANRLSAFSCYSQTVKFDDYIGEQELLFIFSKDELNDKLLKSFNSDIVPQCEVRYSQSKGYSYAVKRIVTTN